MIKQITLQFLVDLKNNNNREWFHANKKSYEAVKSNLQPIVSEIIERLGQLDKGIANLKPKDCMFRINRDIRFSKNKMPYKTNIGAYFAPGGKKSNNSGYYLHIEPNNHFVAGGMYMPPSPILKKIRQEIDYNTADFQAIITHPDFKNYFGELQGRQLKTAPKGYPRNHPQIELLRFKDYIVSKSLTDGQIKSTNLVDIVMKHFHVMKPLNDFLCQAIQ